jgi:hypothetical protein
MKQFRNLIATITGVIIGIAGLALTAPAAFATEVAPTDGYGATPASVAAAHNTGMSGWEIALIAVAAALASAVITAAVQRIRLRSAWGVTATA